MRIVVTRVAADGSIRRGVFDPALRQDGGRAAELIEQSALHVPPPYRPARGTPVYQIRAGDTTVLVAEEDLVGPLRELVTAALTG